MLETEQNAPQGENDAARTQEPGQGQEARQEAAEGAREEGQEGAAAEPEGEAAEGAEGSERAEEQTEPEADQPDLPKWVQRRIDELTRRRHEAERKAQELADRLSRFNQGPGESGEGAQAEAEQAIRQENPALSQEQVRAEAQRIVSEQQFNNDCNAAFEAGASKFPDFEKTVQKFQNLGGLPQDFITDALSAGNAHLTLYHLGRNLDEADRVMSLPPRQRMAALARLSDKLAAPPPPKPISRAPAPIEPVNGAGRPSALNTDPDALSTEEWMRRRNAGEIR
jgi:hypothetical protein